MRSIRSLGHFRPTGTPTAASSAARATATARAGAAAPARSCDQGRAALSHTPPGGDCQGRPCWPWPKRCRRASTARGRSSREPDPASSAGSAASTPAWPPIGGDCHSHRSSSRSVLAHTARARSRQGRGRPPRARVKKRWARWIRPTIGAGLRVAAARRPSGRHRPPAPRRDAPGPAVASPRRRVRSRCRG